VDGRRPLIATPALLDRASESPFRPTQFFKPGAFEGPQFSANIGRDARPDLLGGQENC
jgi:hypothetical protein